MTQVSFAPDVFSGESIENEKTWYTKWRHVTESIYVNYKIWSLFTLFSIILCNGDIFRGITTFLYAYMYSYIGHALMHSDLTFYSIYGIYSISHYWHDRNSDWMTNLVNIIAEFSILVFNYNLPKYLFATFPGNPMNYLIDEWVGLFYCIIFISVHYINYTHYKVNQFHVKHHVQSDANFSPDFFDIIFDTKHPDSLEPENIEHEIPNTILAFAITFAMKCIYDQLLESDKIIWRHTAMFILLFLTISLFATSTSILKKIIDDKCSDAMRFAQSIP